MSTHISLAVIDGGTTDGSLVKFEAHIDGDEDALEVGTAVGAAVMGVGIARKLQALAYAMRHIGNGCGDFAACTEFLKAADTYIEFWETYDNRFEDKRHDN